MWCLGLDRISRKFHTTARVEVTTGTTIEFVTDYLAENRRRIEIIWKLSVNNSVQFLGLSDQYQGIGLPFICNLIARVDDAGWGSGNYSNKDWGGRSNNNNSMANVAWGASVDPRLAYLLWSPVNPRTSQLRVCNDFLFRRHQEGLWRQ